MMVMKNNGKEQESGERREIIFEARARNGLQPFIKGLRIRIKVKNDLNILNFSIPYILMLAHIF
jgi:hypothetical protein